MTRQVSNWLQHYLRLTNNTEPPVLYHLWSGIMAISSCLQRKCWIDWGHESIIYPNLYVVLVGPPGGRKGTAMKIAKSLVQKLDIALSSDSLGSIQTLYKEIKGAESSYIHPVNCVPIHHKSLSIWSEEFQVFLSDSDPRLIGNLTDLFDAPSKWKYSSITRGLEDLSNCWLNLFGAITPSLLQTKLNSDAVGGGLISRIIFVVGYGKIKKVPMTHLSDEEFELRDMLLEDLEHIKNMSGQFIMSDNFIETYSTWYMSASSNQGVDSEKFIGYNERRALHLRKLCMVFCASESSKMLLRKHHFNIALHVLTMTEQEMPNAFYGLGHGSHSTILTNVLTYMKTNNTVSWKKLLERFQLDVLPNELEQIIDLAVQTGRLRQEYTPNKDRHFTYNDIRESGDNNYYNNELFKFLE